VKSGIRNSKFEIKAKLWIRVFISNLESRISNPFPEQAKNRRGCAEAGFTLLEVLVALAVLALGAVMTLSLISGSLGNIRKVQLKTRTIEHAQSVLEMALLDASIQQPTAYSGDFEDGTRWSVRIEEYIPDVQPQPQTLKPINLPVKLLYYTVEMTSPDSRVPGYRLQTLKLVKTSGADMPLRLPQ
jgi:prepilin-type N-terminal cleavage/methylation domain-containing protein